MTDVHVDDFCTLCAEPRGDRKFLEVGILGPERRVHAACWKTLTDHKPLDDRKAFLRSVIAHEDETGVTQWLQGLPNRQGLAQYTHLIRSPLDPERSTREERRERYGDGASTEWKRLTAKATVDAWMAAIVELLLDGAPRTFNAICVELADITADVAAGKSPDEALWSLVAWRAVQWTNRAPVRFRINPQPPLLQVGEDYPFKKGSKVARVLSVGGEPPNYHYTVEIPGSGDKYDQYERALAPQLKGF